jgi:GxxExxY protein
MNHRDTETQRAELNNLTQRVIGLCIEVHRELGPGLLESAYEEALAFELTQAGVSFKRQLETPLRYKGVSLNCGFRLDFLIEEKLILELKAVNELLPVHHAQLLTYLKLDRRSLGLLVNFNVPALKDGVRRIASGELFKTGRPGTGQLGILALLLCASVSLWFKTFLS